MEQVTLPIATQAAQLAGTHPDFDVKVVQHGGKNWAVCAHLGKFAMFRGDQRPRVVLVELADAVEPDNIDVTTLTGPQIQLTAAKFAEALQKGTVVDPANPVAPKAARQAGESKLAKARVIFAEMHARNEPRRAILEAFNQQLGLSKTSTGPTYYQQFMGEMRDAASAADESN